MVSGQLNWAQTCPLCPVNVAAVGAPVNPFALPRRCSMRPRLAPVQTGSDSGVCSAPRASQNQDAQTPSGSGLWFLGAGQQCSLPQTSLTIKQTPTPASALFLTFRPPGQRPRVDLRVSEMKSLMWVSGNAAAGAGSVRGGAAGLRRCPYPMRRCPYPMLPQKTTRLTLMGSRFLPCFRANVPLIFGWVLPSGRLD